MHVLNHKAFTVSHLVISK